MQPILYVVFAAVAVLLAVIGFFAGSAYRRKAAENAIGSAEDAKITAKLSEDYTNVSLLENAGTFDKLFDGDDRKEEALAWGSDNANVVAFKNADATKADANATLCLIIDLGEERTLSSMTISFYKDYNVMIGLGAENTLTVSSSDNGTDFTKVEDFTFESEAIEDAADGTPDKTKFPVAGVYDETFKFTNNVTARYLELKIPYEETHPKFADGKIMWEFIGMTEIAFADGTPSTDTSEPATDESKAESVATSEAPSTSSTAPTSSTTESSKTPVTGDAGLAAIAVIAVIALAGTVVVARKRG